MTEQAPATEGRSSAAESPTGPGTRPDRAAGVVIERVAERHRSVVLEFFRSEWGETDDGNGELRGGGFDPSVPQWVCLRDGEVIGYLGTIPVRFRLDGETVPGHWLKGFWVKSEFRSGPVGFMLAKHAVGELGPVAASLVALPARRLLEAMGMTERCVLFNRICLLRPARVAARLDLHALRPESVAGPTRYLVRVLQRSGVAWVLGRIGGWALSAIRRSARPATRDLVVRYDWEVPDEALDAVWARLRDQVGGVAVRDAAALRERYEAEGAYRLVSVWEKGSLGSWAVVRRPRRTPDPRLSGIRVASLSDLWFPLERTDLATAAIDGAEKAASDLGADALLCSGSGASLEGVLRRRGYLRFPGNLRILARDREPARFPTQADEFWVTRGDGRSDETF